MGAPKISPPPCIGGIPPELGPISKRSPRRESVVGGGAAATCGGEPAICDKVGCAPDGSASAGVALSPPTRTGRAARFCDDFPATKEDGGRWYTDARLEMWQMSSSNRLGSMRSVSSEIKGFSAKTTSYNKEKRNSVVRHL